MASNATAWMSALPAAAPAHLPLAERTTPAYTAGVRASVDGSGVSADGTVQARRKDDFVGFTATLGGSDISTVVAVDDTVLGSPPRGRPL